MSNGSMFRNFCYVLGASTLLILLWAVAVYVLSIPAYLIPSPAGVASALVQDSRYLAWHSLVTAGEALAGLLAAITVGFLVAALLSNFESARVGLLPLIVAAQAIPIVAVAPIFSLWFGTGFVSKAAMAALLCWFPTVVNATRGFLEVDPTSMAMFKLYGASSRQLFLKLKLPSAVSFVVSGIRISSGLAMIGAIVAEYVGADQGLGYVIMQATYRVDTERLFAAVLCGAILGMMIAELMQLLAARLFTSYFRW